MESDGMRTLQDVFRPSAYDRWSKCTIAPHREAEVAGTTSRAAERGTALHAVAAELLEAFLDGHSPPLDRESIDPAVRRYVLSLIHDYAILSAAFAKVEFKTDLSEWLLPGTKGTADAVIVHGSCLELHDFKSGRRYEVFAKNNGQLSLYSLGVARHLSLIGIEFEEIKLVIHQPNMKSEPDEHTMSFGELERFGTSVKELRTQIENGGRACVGEHCGFCAYASKCPELNAVVDEALAEPVTDANLGAKFAKLEVIEAYVSSVRNAVTQAWKSGKRVPGTRYVVGPLGHRRFKLDSKEDLLGLEAIAGDALYTREMLSPAQLEKMLPRDKVPFLDQYITRNRGEPRVVIDTPQNSKYEDASVIDEFGVIE